MRPGLVAMGAIALGAAVIADGCSRACTLIGCQDQFSATVLKADGTFPSGTHQVDVVADGVSLTCTFTFPLPTPQGGGTVPPSCSPGMTVYVEQAVETITLSGTPSQVDAQQHVDGTLILEASGAPMYQVSAPNGSECGPICHQASVDWTLQ
jgi:hypothetical protein